MVVARTQVLFVCLGNICRSPTAEGVFRHLVGQAGLAHQFVIDSAGTGAYHAGEPPDQRMRKAASAAGFELEGQARQVLAEDFEHFDHILAMDHQNLADLKRIQPAEGKAHLRLFRELDPDAPGADVPDPYYGGPRGFDEVVRIVERTSRVLLAELSSSERA